MDETPPAAETPAEVDEPVYWPSPCPPRPPLPAHFRSGFYWPQIFREHPALGLSVSYAILTLAGAGYAGFYFWILKVNFLQLTDAADFLVMVFRHPFVPLLLLLPFPLFNLYMATSYRVVWWARWRFRWLGRKLPNPAGPPKYGVRVQRIMGYSFFALYAIAGLEFYALHGALRVREGKGDRIVLEVRPGNKSAAMEFDAKEVIFLGATTHFTIVYDPEEKRAWSLPHDTISRIMHPARQKKDDEPAAAESEGAATLPPLET